MARVSFTLRSTAAQQGSYLGGPPPVPPPPDIMGEAVLWLDADSSTQSYIPNLGTGGSALNAASAGTVAPVHLPHNGFNYVYLPGTTGNYLSLDNLNVPTITDQMELVARVSMEDWTPTTPQTFMSRGDTLSGTHAYSFDLGTDGKPSLTLSIDGDNTTTCVALDPVSFSDGDIGWVKATWSNEFGTVTFYESLDNVTWVSLGVSATTAYAGEVLYNTNDDFLVGSYEHGTDQLMAGAVYRVIIRDTINGVADFELATEFDVVDGADTSLLIGTDDIPMTVHRSTSGFQTALVTRPVWLFSSTPGTALEVADNDLLDFGTTDPVTILVVHREWTASNYAGLIGKRVDATNTNAGWGAVQPNSFRWLLENRGGGTTDDWATTLPNPSFAAGDFVSLLFVKGGSGTNATWINTTSTPSTDTNIDWNNSEPLSIGRTSSSTGYMSAEVMAVAVWDRALSTEEINTVVTYYDATQGLRRDDFDWMLRADNLVLAPDSDYNALVDFGGEINPLEGVFVGTGPGGSIGGGGSSSNIANREGSYFAAGSHCYGEVDLIWGVEGLPRTATSPPLGLTPQATGTVLVYSDQGEPQTIASGDILSESTDGFTYRHTGLPEGRWAYYSLFVHLQTGDGTEFYERGASIAVLIPRNYGSTLQLWRRIPAYYRLQDVAQGTTVYPECLGVEEIGAVGPLFKYLSIVGFDMDRMRTTLDYMMDSRDPDDAHTEVLDALAEQMGVLMRSSDLGPARLRRLMGDIGSYRRSKGTASAVEFLGQAIAGGDVTVDRDTNEITIYSTRTNYVSDPKDATGLIDHRPAGNVEITDPEEFSSTTYDAYTDTYTVDGTEYVPTGMGASAGVECVMIRLLQDVYVTSGDRLCFSVHSNIGTDAIKWVRAYSDDIELRDANGDILTVGISLGTLEITDDSDTNLLTDDGDAFTLQDESYFDEEALTAPTTAAVSGISFTPLQADGARAFEVEIQTTSPDSYERCGIEFLVNLSEVDDEEGDPGKFVLKNLLLEKNYLGGYFDGDTVRGGWLIDTNSISDYRWEGTPYESASIYAEEYVRTNGVIDSILLDAALPITVTPYFNIAKYDAVDGIDNLV